MKGTVAVRVSVLLALGGLFASSSAWAGGPPPGVYVGVASTASGTPLQGRIIHLVLDEAKGVLAPVRLRVVDVRGDTWKETVLYTGVYSEVRNVGTLACDVGRSVQVTLQWAGDRFRGTIEGPAGTLGRFAAVPSTAAPGMLNLEDLSPVTAMAGEGFMVKFAYTYRGKPGENPWLAEEVTISPADGREPPVTCREVRWPDVPDGSRRMRPQYEARVFQPGDYTITVKVQRNPPGPTEELTKQTTLRVTRALAGGGGVLFTRGEPIIKRSAAAENFPGLQYYNGDTFLTYVCRDDEGYGWHNRVEWPVMPPTLQLGEELPLYLRVTRTDLAGIRASLVTGSIVDETKLRVQSWPKSDQDQFERKTIRFQVTPGSDRAVIRVTAAVGKSPLEQVGQSDPVVQVTYEYRRPGSSAGAVPTGRPTIIDRTPATEYQTLPRGGTIRLQGAIPAVGGEGVETAPGGEQRWAPVQPDQPLGPGDGLRTGQLGVAVLPLPDGTVAGLAPGTQVTLTSAGLELVHGQVMLNRMDQPAGEPAVVETSAARIRDLGTSYTVTHDPATGMTTVEVHSGMVEVTPAEPGAEPFVLGSGERTTVRGPATTTPVAGGTGTGTGTGTGGGPGDTGGPAADFSGNWVCDAPPFVGFTMVVSQDGTRASGYYDQPPGRIAFDGEVTGRVLRLRWRHTFDEVTGSGRLTLSDDGQSFTGGWNSTADPEAPAAGAWNGRRTATGGMGPGTGPGGTGGPAADFGGDWTCDDQSSTDFLMVVRQDGSRATGYHTPQAGKIEFDGEVTGRVLRLRWRHTFDAAAGSAKLTLSDDGQSFIGGWNSTSDPEAPAEGPWTGRRGASFAGTWTCDAPPFMGFTMVVSQDGTRASGYYDQAPGRIAFDGEVTGRALRLRWRHTFDEVQGSGKLTLSDDGQSFVGGWNSTPDPEAPAEGAWTGRRTGTGPRTPQVGFFAGLWTVDDSYARYTMNLEQDGRRVTGTYDRLGGTLEGMVTGRTLTGTWRQPDDNRSGTLRFGLSQDGQAFEGTWACPDRDPKEGPWTGRRVPLR